ncbi:MAG: isochorismatase family protein [Candidatus Aminicenantes bacterium]|nr:isochorismatase family protein [Candidatus Aminicenantes bacterium]
MKKIVFLMLLLLISLAWLLAADTVQEVPARMKPALLVIDIQNAYLPHMDDNDKKLGMEMINYYIGLFRASGFPVIRVYHTDLKMGPKPGTAEFEFPTTVAVLAEDAKIIKNYPSAFKKTELDKLLHAQGCNTLFLCGLSAVGCVLATYHGAKDLDYNVFMLKDALISHDATLTKAVQQISQTIDYYVLKLLLENVRK